jgi:hypothetical protein
MCRAVISYGPTIVRDSRREKRSDVIVNEVREEEIVRVFRDREYNPIGNFEFRVGRGIPSEAC